MTAAADLAALTALSTGLGGLWDVAIAACGATCQQFTPAFFCTTLLGLTCTSNRPTGLNLRGTLKAGAGRRRLSAFGGFIPAGFGSLSTLQALDLGANGLTGSIPADMGSLSALQTLALDANTISGSIPPSFASLVQLRALNLTGNAVSGDLSPLAALVNIQSLGLANNAITGTLPPALQASILANGGTASLAGNAGMAACGLADSVGDCGALCAASAAWTPTIWAGASVRGTSVCGWAGVVCNTAGRITAVVQSGQGLAGTIPPEFGNMSSLVSLNLASNALSGTIPVSLGSLGSLQTLLLANNALTGSIPASVRLLAGLTNASFKNRQPKLRGLRLEGRRN